MTSASCCAPPLSEYYEYGRSALSLDELDLVTIRVLHEGNHRGAAFDRPRLASDGTPFFAHRAAGRGCVGNLDGDVSVPAAEIVSIHAVIVGQLEHRVL